MNTDLSYCLMHCKQVGPGFCTFKGVVSVAAGLGHDGELLPGALQ